MKTRKIIAVAAGALSLTGALGAASATPAFAGCGVSIEVHNKTASDITVQWADSDSRSTIFGIAGNWKKLDTGTTTVSAGAVKSRAITLDTSCSNDHQYRLEINQGGNSWFVTSSWTGSTSPHIDVV